MNSLEGDKPSETVELDKHAEGTILGQYVFGHNLGKGTFGQVKLATHQLTQELVSINIFIFRSQLKFLRKPELKKRKTLKAFIFMIFNAGLNYKR